MIMLVAALFAASCSKGLEYNVTVQNLNNDYKMVYLYNVEDSMKCIDSVAVENGVATLQGKVDESIIACVSAQPKNFMVPLLLDEQATTITYADGQATIATGSSENMQIAAFLQSVTDCNKKLEEIKEDYALLVEKNGGNLEPQDIKSIENRYDEIVDGAKWTHLSMLNANKENLVPALILCTHSSALETEDIIDFMKEYKYAERPCLAEIRERIESVSRTLPGSMVTDFVMDDITGKECHLTDFVGKGNYVLVDFWASWCGPCRREMPAVKAAYEKFHSKGFEIVGVSLDNNKADWEKAVADLGITWTQLSDLKGWQCKGAEVYGVRAIPCTILFDGEGRVVEANLRGEALADKLAELYK